MNETTEQTLGGKIREIRMAKGLSQSEIERRTGLKREYLSKIENCDLKNPTYLTLKKLAKGMGCSINLFFPVQEDTEKDNKILELEGKIVKLEKSVEKDMIVFQKIKEFMADQN